MKESRKLSDDFVGDLKNGPLTPVLERVKRDHTLMLALRGDYVNVYYRGGSLMKITADKGKLSRSYTVFFDTKYDKSRQNIPILPKRINQSEDARSWVSAFPQLKQVMDEFFSHKPKLEREFQQLAARENNNSTISSETEYFITDIEFSDPAISARFDMLAVHWPANARKDGRNCRAALIEMKYGDGALSGEAGLMKHLRDIESVVNDKDKCRRLIQMTADQFCQLDELGLLRFNHSVSGTKISLGDRIEVVFLLANLNPRGRVLTDIIGNPDFGRFESPSLPFDLRFFVASCAGYGMHADCMMKLPQFKERIGRLASQGAPSLINQRAETPGLDFQSHQL